jgi:arylsulfatase A-like enzyme
LDGIDLVPILAAKKPQQARTFYWLSPFPGNLDTAMRDGHWKYVSQSALFPGMLFDLRSDPGEHHDLAAKRPDLLKRFKEMHRKWTRSVRATQAAAQ